MLVAIGLNFFSSPFILKSLSSEIYGLSIVIFQITAYLGMFDFGLNAGISRYLAGSRGDDVKTKEAVAKIISTSFVSYAILGLMVAIVGNILAPFVSHVFDIPIGYRSQVAYIVSAISVLLGFQFLLRAITGIFFAHQRQVLSNTLSFILSIGNTAMVMLFLHFGWQLWSFVLAQLVVFIISGILNIYFFKKYYGYVILDYKKFDFSLLKEMFSYGFFLFLSGIAVQVVFETDRILIGSIISLTAVSVYSLSSRVPELLSQFIWKVVDNSFPAMVELSKGDSNEFKTVHDKIMQLTLSLSTYAFWIIILISYPFLKLWVGEDFYAGNGFMFIIAYLYLIQHTIIHVTAVCLNGAGIVKKIAFMAICEAVINVLLSIWLGNLYGLKGVVLGTIFASLLTTGWYIPFISIKYFKSSLMDYILVILKPLFVLSIPGIIMYVLLNGIFNKLDNWGTLVIYGVIIAALGLIPIYLLNKSMILKLKKAFM